MIDDLMDANRQAAEQVSGRRATTRHGIVTSYDPNNYAIKVELQPDGVLTGWIPLKSSWVGNGWGLFCPPAIGDHIELDFQEGDKALGSAGWRFYNDNIRPLPCPSGEFWLVHKSGQFIKVTNDGALTLNDAHGASVQLDGAGNIKSAGNWTHTGKLHTSDTVTSDVDVLANGISLHNHTHSDPQGGIVGRPQ
jgi:hypothetical protein